LDLHAGTRAKHEPKLFEEDLTIWFEISPHNTGGAATKSERLWTNRNPLIDNCVEDLPWQANFTFWWRALAAKIASPD